MMIHVLPACAWSIRPMDFTCRILHKDRQDNFIDKFINYRAKQYKWCPPCDIHCCYNDWFISCSIIRTNSCFIIRPCSCSNDISSVNAIMTWQFGKPRLDRCNFFRKVTSSCSLTTVRESKTQSTQSTYSSCRKSEDGPESDHNDHRQWILIISTTVPRVRSMRRGGVAWLTF